MINWPTGRRILAPSRPGIQGSHPLNFRAAAIIFQNGLSFRQLFLKPSPVSRMSALTPLVKTPNRRIAVIAAGVICVDQLTKALVQHWLGAVGQEKIVVPGFFKFVHWQNTGAAWSIFRDNNTILAMVAVFALGVLYFSRHHFDVRTPLSQVAFGLICGGIVGNLIDRVHEGHVIDFLYFYLQQRGGGEIGFPAFNVADSAICTGVGLVFLLSLKADRKPKEPESAPAK